MRWFNQITPNDSFVVGCKAGNENCPDDVGPDHDFGSSPILRTVGGRRMLLLGQKSGVIFGLDPDNGGKVLWQQRVGKGSELGGIEWGPAADERQRLRRGVRRDRARRRSERTAGRTARAAHCGWSALVAHAGAAAGLQGRARLLAARSRRPISVIPGVVFSGSVDGHMRAYSATDGKIIWEFNTMREFETVNGVKGAGGSIDAAGPVIVDGMVLTNSGYGRWRGKPGNVLLAFGVKYGGRPVPSDGGRTITPLYQPA